MVQCHKALINCSIGGRRGDDRVVVEFTTTSAMNAYDH